MHAHTYIETDQQIHTSTIIIYFCYRIIELAGKTNSQKVAKLKYIILQEHNQALSAFQHICAKMVFMIYCVKNQRDV